MIESTLQKLNYIQTSFIITYFRPSKRYNLGTSKYYYICIKWIVSLNQYQTLWSCIAIYLVIIVIVLNLTLYPLCMFITFASPMAIFVHRYRPSQTELTIRSQVNCRIDRWLACLNLSQNGLNTSLSQKDGRLRHRYLLRRGTPIIPGGLISSRDSAV